MSRFAVVVAKSVSLFLLVLACLLFCFGRARANPVYFFGEHFRYPQASEGGIFWGTADEFGLRRPPGLISQGAVLPQGQIRDLAAGPGATWFLAAYDDGLYRIPYDTSFQGPSIRLVEQATISEVAVDGLRREVYYSQFAADPGIYRVDYVERTDPIKVVDVPIPFSVDELVVDPVTQDLYWFAGNTLRRYDAQAQEVLDLPVALDSPGALEIDARGRSLFISDFGAPSVIQVVGFDGVERADLDVWPSPAITELAYDPRLNGLHFLDLSSPLDQSLRRLDLTTGQLTFSLLREDYATQLTTLAQVPEPSGVASAAIALLLLPAWLRKFKRGSKRPEGRSTRVRTTGIGL